MADIKVKTKRTAIHLDMTPLVDLGFLLVAFFMLTTKFAPEDPVIVDTPSSISQKKLPENGVLTILTDGDGKIYFNVDGQPTRLKLIERIGREYGIEFSDNEKRSFMLLNTMGIPVASLKQFLNMDSEKRKDVVQPGIPADSANNELSVWIQQARLASIEATEKSLRIAIKGDGSTPMPVVRDVMNTLQNEQNKINRFNLITDLEQNPNE